VTERKRKEEIIQGKKLREARRKSRVWIAEGFLNRGLLKKRIRYLSPYLPINNQKQTETDGSMAPLQAAPEREGDL